MTYTLIFFAALIGGLLMPDAADHDAIYMIALEPTLESRQELVPVVDVFIKAHPCGRHSDDSVPDHVFEGPIPALIDDVPSPGDLVDGGPMGTAINTAKTSLTFVSDGVNDWIITATYP